VALAEKFPEAQEKEILKVIGNLVYYKFINPAVIAPDKYTTFKLLSLCAYGSGLFYGGGLDTDPGFRFLTAAHNFFSLYCGLWRVFAFDRMNKKLNVRGKTKPNLVVCNYLFFHLIGYPDPLLTFMSSKTS
jgi:hypothetical protein